MLFWHSISQIFETCNKELSWLFWSYRPQPPEERSQYLPSHPYKSCGLIGNLTLSDLLSVLYLHACRIVYVFPFLITAVWLLGYIWNHNLRPVNFLLASVSSVTCQHFDFRPVNRSTCSREDPMVWPSYSLRKDMAPRIMPVTERMMDTLLPDSYFLCSLPLLIHCTSGSWME